MGSASFLLRLRSGAHELLERARPHRPRRLSAGEARAETALAAAYLAGRASLVLADSTRPPPAEADGVDADAPAPGERPLKLPR
jgi:hypothetical protein